MNWGNDQQKQAYVQFLLEQYAFLKDPKPVCPYLPVCVDVDISNRCNLKCISCFHSIKKFKSMSDMTMETFLKVMDQVDGRVARITIGNHGEPFLHKHVFEMLHEIKKRGIFLNVINNGTLLDKDKAHRLLDVGVDRLVFSLDSVDPKQYAIIRRNANLKTTLRNILYFLKINYEAGMKTYVNISTVDTKEALASKIDIFKYFSKLPVHTVYTSSMLNFHDMLEIRDQTKFCQQYKDEKDNEKMPICINGFDRMLIRPNGNASLCGIDWDSVHVLGNVHDAPYYELWNNEKAQQIRRALINRDYSAIEQDAVLCSRCDLKWQCSTQDQQQVTLKMLCEDLRDMKAELDAEVGTAERYEHLLQALKEVERSD